jgi:ATP synthase protein I
VLWARRLFSVGWQVAEDDDGLSPEARAQRAAAPWLNAAWRVVGGVLVGAGVGWLVDEKLLHSTPWGLVVGLMLGLGAGFYALLQAVGAVGRKR